MKKVLRILLIVLLLALIAAAALAWHYRDYLRAFSNSRKYSTEDLQQQLADNQAALEDILSLYLPPQDGTSDTLEDLPPSEQSGAAQVSPQEETASSGNKPNTPPDTSQAMNDEPPKVDPEITKIVATFDSLRAEYLSRLEGLKDRAYREYKGKSFTKKELVNFAAGFVREATVMEVECDNRVFALLAELEKVIEKNGGDSTLPDKILEYYLNEKQLTKAMYISELEKRGLIL